MPIDALLQPGLRADWIFGSTDLM